MKMEKVLDLGFQVRNNVGITENGSDKSFRNSNPSKRTLTAPLLDLHRVVKEVQPMRYF